MANLRAGFDLFAATTQAGTDSKVPGLVVAETAEKGAHGFGIQRLSDDEYYNATTKAFQSGRPAVADEVSFAGSDSARGIHPAIRRLSERPPKEALAGITAAGAKLLVYRDDDRAGTEITLGLEFQFFTAI